MSSSQLTNSYVSEGWLNHQPGEMDQTMNLQPSWTCGMLMERDIRQQTFHHISPRSFKIVMICHDNFCWVSLKKRKNDERQIYHERTLDLIPVLLVEFSWISSRNLRPRSPPKFWSRSDPICILFQMDFVGKNIFLGAKHT